MKVGQLFIIGLSGLELTREEKLFIEDNDVGGVILFKKNYENPAQLAELCNSLKQTKTNSPLFISVDYEGGRVQRFKEGMTLIPPMSKVAQKSSPKLCYEVHKLVAEELSQLGVNLNFSPCCDLSEDSSELAIGDRSFGEDVDKVSKYVTAAVRGLQTNGLIACAKHFPNHGRTKEDSHYVLPKIEASLSELLKKDLVPYKKVCKARVGMIMMSHIICKGLSNGNLPVSLSSNSYDWIRQELKFRNLIITDDFEMHAIQENFTLEESLKLAYSAGADLTIFRSFINGTKAIRTFEKILKNSDINRELFEDKVNRIDKFKKDYITNYKEVYLPSLEGKFASTKKFKLNK